MFESDRTNNNVKSVMETTNEEKQEEKVNSWKNMLILSSFY